MLKDPGLNMSLFKANTTTTMLENSVEFDTNPTLQPLDSNLFTIDTPGAGSYNHHQQSNQVYNQNFS